MPLSAALVCALAVSAPLPIDLAPLQAAPAGGPRAAAATRPLLGAPYLPSPLGEGGGRDPDPRFRLDAFDCMTFIETAIALASASSLDEARLALDDVRYDGPPSLASRNHEVLSQWVPSNLRKGWIADATGALAGGAAHPAEKEYSHASWDAVRAAGRAIRGMPRTRFPVGKFGVDVVSPPGALALAPRLPEGAILFVVRADAPDRATLVTHAGLVVRGPTGAAFVRHATSSRGVGRVIEEPIERFLRRQARAYPRWPLDGVAIFTIPDATTRVRTLAAGAAHEPLAAPLPPRL